MLIVRIVRKCD